VILVLGQNKFSRCIVNWPHGVEQVVYLLSISLSKIRDVLDKCPAHGHVLIDIATNVVIHLVVNARELFEDPANVFLR